MGEATARVRRRNSVSRKSPRKTPSQARSRDTVDTILEATARVLATRGYAGTNTNRVADVAGVSVGSVYQYFRDKEALVATLRDRHSQQMHELIGRVIKDTSNRSLGDGIAMLVRALLDAHLQNAALHAILEREFPSSDGHHDDQSDRQILRLVQDFLQGHASAIAVQNLAVAAYVVFKTIVSFVHASVVESRSEVKSADFEDEIVKAVMGYLTLPRSPIKTARSEA
jgi:AcrR family transcriptional regulator